MQQTNYQADILVDNVRWYVKLRWLYIWSLGLSWLGGKIVFEGWDKILIPDVVLLFVGLLANGVFYMLAKSPNRPLGYYYRLAIAELAADITTASIVLYEHGGVNARTIILYAIPIFVAGVLFGNAALLLTVGAAAIAYDMTVLMHAINNNILGSIGGQTIVLLLFYNTVFLMIGLVAKHSFDKSTEVLVERNNELLAFNEAKDDFISIASHQLRTPATAVKQFVGMLLQGYFGKLSKDQVAALDTAYSSNERQLKIVNELLQVARIDVNSIQFKSKRQNIIQIVESVLAEQKAELKKRKQILKLDAPKKVMALVDSSLIHMVLDNVLSNASKYSPDGKPIKVKVRQLNGFAIIAIQDKGYGMSKQDQPKLFKKFTRIKNVNINALEGSGLGLYWSKKIVDMHNGDIEVVSAEGKGTTVSIRLPQS
jgi:signal transduction histidine kinase